MTSAIEKLKLAENAMAIRTYRRGTLAVHATFPPSRLNLLCETFNCFPLLGISSALLKFS